MALIVFSNYDKTKNLDLSNKKEEEVLLLLQNTVAGHIQELNINPIKINNQEYNRMIVNDDGNIDLSFNKKATEMYNSIKNIMGNAVLVHANEEGRIK